MSRRPSLGEALDWLFSDEPDEGPLYDPAHVGAAIVATLTAFGALYWLLWTLLVYEGGLLGKITPALAVLSGTKTLAQVGYEGPWNRGPFEGWLGNLGALALTLGLVAALARLYRGRPRWK